MSSSLASLATRHYSIKAKDRIFVKGYGSLPFAKNMTKNFGKNISKNFSCKKKLLVHSK